MISVGDLPLSDMLKEGVISWIDGKKTTNAKRVRVILES
jgi:hypothetical protein